MMFDGELPDFLVSEQPTAEYVYEAAKYYGLEYPDIIMAQAILETGHFKSYQCRVKKNLFGLMNPSTGKPFVFNTWQESVLAYKTKVQYKYREGEDYYKFLERIGYAEDKQYTSKLKIINSKNK